tara:strand:+ start:874 stop:1125 length:252 start_codon:yes stop_codon:yes gene_type:complete
MSNILTPEKVNMAAEAEPHEILFAIHKRVVDTENLMAQYRTHAQNLEVTIAMLQERIEKLENQNKKGEGGIPYTSVYGEDEVK